jgi:hypothetical protein
MTAFVPSTEHAFAKLNLGISKNSEFAQMQGVEKISQRRICEYVSKKFFPQRSSWDEI